MIATTSRAAPSRMALIERIEKNLPRELLAREQWVVWKYQTRDNKQTKIPFSAKSGKAARSHDARGEAYRATWATWEEAKRAYTRGGWAGVGYMFAKDDPYCGVDLDDCTDAQGLLIDTAQTIIDSFASYAERSPSRRGAHVLIRATLPAESGKKRPAPWREAAHVEAYSSERFFTVTGDHIASTPRAIEARQSELDAFAATYLRAKSSPAPAPAASAKQAISLSDERVLRLARNGAGGAGEDFARRWRGEAGGDAGDLSQLDFNLCRTLAWYAQGDSEQVERLWLASQAGERVKTQRREDYRTRTITNAIASLAGSYYAPHAAPPANQPRGAQASEPPAPTRGLHLTELGNAERLIAQHGDALLYSYTLKSWLAWDGRRWIEDDTGAVTQRAIRTVRSIYAEAAQEEDSDKRKLINKHAVASESANKINALVSLARSMNAISTEELDSGNTAWLLNCANGIVDLRTGELRAHDRSLHITNLSPVAYDASAECPIFLAFLKRIMNDDQEMIDFLQRAIGYTLIGDPIEQVVFIPHGSGANGKSTLLSVLRDLLGDYAKHAAAETFMAHRSEKTRNDLARLRGARLVTSVETEESHRLAESLIKQVTGGDPITARFLYGEEFSYTPRFALWLATNHKPAISGSDEAIWRRIRLIPFSVRIPDDERDRTLPARLRAELPGILAWAVRGTIEYAQRGLGEPRAVREATDSYRAEMDIVARFMSEHTVSDTDGRILHSDLYLCYQTWARDAGERIMSSRELAAHLRESGYRIERGTANKTFVYDVRIGPPISEPDEASAHSSTEEKGGLVEALPSAPDDAPSEWGAWLDEWRVHNALQAATPEEMAAQTLATPALLAKLPSELLPHAGNAATLAKALATALAARVKTDYVTRAGVTHYLAHGVDPRTFVVEIRPITPPRAVGQPAAILPFLPPTDIYTDTPTHPCPHCHKRVWALAKPPLSGRWLCKVCHPKETN